MVPKRAPSVMMHTESGVPPVSPLSRKSAAKKLRRWLADEVLPRIRVFGGNGGVELRRSRMLRPAPKRRRLPAKVERLTQAPAEAVSKLRAAATVALIQSPAFKLIALTAPLEGKGHGGGRYWTREGMTDRQLRTQLSKDVKPLAPRQRDQLARWMAEHLSVC